MALETTGVKPEAIVEAFARYMEHEGKHLTRAQFERNLIGKLRDNQFAADIQPLLAAAYKWDRNEGARVILERIISGLPGAPWKGEHSKSKKAGKEIVGKKRRNAERKPNAE